MELSEDEIEELKLIQHSMALEGHDISLEELIEVRKESLSRGDDQTIASILKRAKEEGISQLEATRRYFTKTKEVSNE